VPLSISELTSKNHPSVSTVQNVSLLPTFQTSSWTKGSSIDISLCLLAASLILRLLQCLILAAQQYFPMPLLLAPFHPGCPCPIHPTGPLMDPPPGSTWYFIENQRAWQQACLGSSFLSSDTFLLPIAARHSCCSVQMRRQKAGPCELRTCFACGSRYQQTGSAEISDRPQFQLLSPFPAPDYATSLMPVSTDRYCGEPRSP